MLDLKKEFNNILYEDECILNDYFPILLSPLGPVGKAFHGKMYTGVNAQVYLCHSADWQSRGVSEGY